MKIYEVRFVIGSGADRQRFSIVVPGKDAEEARKNFGFIDLLISTISGGQVKPKGVKVNAIVFGADLKGTSLASTVRRPKKKKVRK